MIVTPLPEVEGPDGTEEQQHRPRNEDHGSDLKQSSGAGGLHGHGGIRLRAGAEKDQSCLRGSHLAIPVLRPQGIREVGGKQSVQGSFVFGLGNDTSEVFAVQSLPCGTAFSAATGCLLHARLWITVPCTLTRGAPPHAHILGTQIPLHTTRAHTHTHTTFNSTNPPSLYGCRPS